MIRELPTPDPNLGYYTELVARTSDRFQALSPIRRGTLYATCIGADQRVIDLYPAGLFFLKETVPIGSSTVAGMTQSDYVRWIWGSDPDAEGVANAEVSYLGDAVANPAFTRAFTIRRDVYDAAPTVALGTAYTALIAIKVTAAGTGYTKDDTVVISGGLGATAALVVNAAGAIQHVVITKEGSGYDSASLPTITITTTTGSGATLVAIVQPKTAVLTSQKKIEFPDSDPQSHQFVRVLRSYEVLPGPYLPFTRYDENLGPIQGRRRAVVNTGQAAAITAISKKTYEARDGSSFVSWEIEENWSDGTGGAGNPAYPILVKDFYDDQRGAVQQTSQIVVATGSEVGSLVNTDGVITRVTYEPYADNPALLRKVIETWSQTGPQLSGQEIDQTFGIPEQFTVQDVAVASAGLGTANRKIKPLNIVQSQITDINTSALTTFLNSYSLVFPGTANLDLPDTLVSLTGVMETNNHVGEYINDEAYGEAIDHGTWSVRVRGDGQGGGQIIPDLQVEIRQTDARNVPTLHYLFFLPAPVTAAAFATKLAALVGASVGAWPKFRPQMHTFTSTGRSLDLSANVDGEASQSWDNPGSGTLSYTSGHGSSRKSGINIRSIRIPPTIHGSISISLNTQTLTLDDVEAHSVVGDAFPGLDEDVVISGEQIIGRITPTSVAATSGVSAIPTSGKYQIGGGRSEPWKYNYVQCHAEVLDFADV